MPIEKPDTLEWEDMDESALAAAEGEMDISDRIALLIPEEETERGGRPKIELESATGTQQLFQLARIGLPKSVIARYFRISTATLLARLRETKYSDAYEGGRAALETELVSVAYEEAVVERNTAVLIRLLESKGLIPPKGQSLEVSLEQREGEEGSTVRVKWTEDMNDEFDGLLEEAHKIIDVTPEDSSGSENPSPAQLSGEVLPEGE
jgi:hypothetical protein